MKRQVLCIYVFLCVSGIYKGETECFHMFGGQSREEKLAHKAFPLEEKCTRANDGRKENGKSEERTRSEKLFRRCNHKSFDFQQRGSKRLLQFRVLILFVHAPNKLRRKLLPLQLWRMTNCVILDIFLPFAEDQSVSKSFTHIGNAMPLIGWIWTFLLRAAVGWDGLLKRSFPNWIIRVWIAHLSARYEKGDTEAEVVVGTERETRWKRTFHQTLQCSVVTWRNY